MRDNCAQMQMGVTINKLENSVGRTKKKIHRCDHKEDV